MSTNTPKSENMHKDDKTQRQNQQGGQQAGQPGGQRNQLGQQNQGQGGGGGQQSGGSKPDQARDKNDMNRKEGSK